MEFTIKTEPAAIWLVTSKRLRQAEIPEFAGHAVGDVEEKAKALGLETAGPPVFVYNSEDGGCANEFLLEIAVPVNAAKGDPSPFSFQHPPPLKCISANYIGSMRGIQDAWNEMKAHVKGSGHRHGGVAREIYHKWIDFDSAENVTELQVGIE